jgi:chromosomal replication initiation ATPase DnaA
MTFDDQTAQFHADRARLDMVTGVAAFALGEVASDLDRDRMRRGAVNARQVAAYVAHVALGMSVQRIAYAARRDRSTIAHAIHRIEDARDDDKFDLWLESIESAVTSAPGPDSAPRQLRRRADSGKPKS